MNGNRGAYRVLLVDDHPVFREGVRSIIHSHPDFQVAAEAGSVQEAMDKLPLCSPDLVVTDLRLGVESGHDLVRKILSEYPALPILILSMVTDTRQVLQSIEAGAKGYITKEAGCEDLLSAMLEVVQGRSYLHPEVAHVLFEKVRQPVTPTQPSFDLTARERDTLEGLCKGLSPQEVSELLFLSVATVKTYMRSLYRKLEVSSRTQLVLKAQELQLNAKSSAPSPACPLGFFPSEPAPCSATTLAACAQSVGDCPAEGGPTTASNGLATT